MSRIPPKKQRALTPRGKATRQKIIEAAAALVYAAGAARLNLDEVMAASRTSKSQLYHYFTDKEALIQEVIAFQTKRVLTVNSDHLEAVDSFQALRRWRDDHGRPEQGRGRLRRLSDWLTGGRTGQPFAAVQKAPGKRLRGLGLSHRECLA